MMLASIVLPLAFSYSVTNARKAASSSRTKPCVHHTVAVLAAALAMNGRARLPAAANAADPRSSERLLSLLMGAPPLLSPWRQTDARSAALLRDHLDLAVEAGLDLEVAVVNLAVVAGDDDVVAFGEDHARKGADRFLDDVAARSEHRPRGVGERLAAALAHELERDHRGTVVHRHVDELAGLHADVGTHHGVAVAVVRDDVIGALGEQHHVAGGYVLGDAPFLARLELAAGVDVEGNLPGGNLAVADAPLEAGTAGRDLEDFAHRLGAQLHPFDRIGEAKRDVHDVTAGGQHGCGWRGALLLDS